MSIAVSSWFHSRIHAIELWSSLITEYRFQSKNPLRSGAIRPSALNSFATFHPVSNEVSAASRSIEVAYFTFTESSRARFSSRPRKSNAAGFASFVRVHSIRSRLSNASRVCGIRPTLNESERLALKTFNLRCVDGPFHRHQLLDGLWFRPTGSAFFRNLQVTYLKR